MKLVRPNAVTNHNTVTALCIYARVEAGTEHRTNAEHREQTGSHAGALDVFRPSRSTQFVRSIGVCPLRGDAVLRFYQRDTGIAKELRRRPVFVLIK